MAALHLADTALLHLHATTQVTAGPCQNPYWWKDFEWWRVPNWDNLPGCLTGNCGLFIPDLGPSVSCYFSSEPTIQEQEGCCTTHCLCRPDVLAEAIPKVSSLAMSRCSDMKAATDAVAVLTAYCSLKGYTSIAALTELPSASGRGAQPSLYGPTSPSQLQQSTMQTLVRSNSSAALISSTTPAPAPSNAPGGPASPNRKGLHGGTIVGLVFGIVLAIVSALITCLKLLCGSRH